MTQAIGIDIGGSAVKLGLVDLQGQVSRRTVLPVLPGIDFAGFAAMLVAAIARLDDAGALAIGIGLPGFPDPETGLVREGADNIVLLQGHSLIPVLAEATGLPVRVENDGVCATEGELRFGAARGLDRAAVVTLGTGIGGGIAIGGRVLRGDDGLPAEIGAMCLDPSRIDVPGSVPGAIEHLASGPALLRRYAALTGNHDAITVEQVFARAKSGEAAAEAVVEEVASWLAQGFGILGNVLNLQAVVVGGGVALAGPYLLDRIDRILPRFLFPSASRRPRILPAANGNDAGLIGAGWLALWGTAS